MVDRPLTSFSIAAELPRDLRLLAFESHWNLGSPSGFGRVEPDARSAVATESVDLQARAIHYSVCVGSGREPPYWPRGARSEADRAFFPVVFHPRVTPPRPSELVRVLPALKGVPTASQRTYAILEPSADQTILGYAKLHHPGVIGRFNRSLTLYQWIHSLEVSRTLVQQRQHWPRDFSLMVEYGGTYVETTADTSGFGALYRSNPVLAGAEKSSPDWIIPAFSLLGDPEAGFESLPLLEFVLLLLDDNRQNGFGELVRRLMSVYVWMACEQGLIPELNAQNLLLVASTTEGRVWMCVRDMADVFQDLDMSVHGSAMPFSRYKAIGRDVSHDLHQRRSFAYDFKLGRYVLLPLAREYCRMTGSDLESVTHMIRAVGRELFAPYKGYFQSETEWWSYPAVADVGRGDYVAHRNPLFR